METQYHKLNLVCNILCVCLIGILCHYLSFIEAGYVRNPPTFFTHPYHPPGEPITSVVPPYIHGYGIPLPLLAKYGKQVFYRP